MYRRSRAASTATATSETTTPRGEAFGSWTRLYTLGHLAARSEDGTSDLGPLFYWQHIAASAAAHRAVAGGPAARIINHFGESRFGSLPPRESSCVRCRRGAPRPAPADPPARGSRTVRRVRGGGGRGPDPTVRACSGAARAARAAPPAAPLFGRLYRTDSARWALCWRCGD